MAEKCQECKHAAECFCLCGGEESLLCKSCYFDHFSQLTDRTHAPYHLPAYAYRSIPGYFQRLQARSAALPLAKDQIRNSLQVVTQCIEELRTQTESFISSLREYSEIKATELQQIHSKLEQDLQASLEEVQATFYEDQPQLQHRFSEALRSGDCDLQPFAYEIHIATVETALQVTYSCDELAVSEDETEPLFAVVGNTLIAFDLRTGESQSFTLTEEFEAGFSIRVISDDQAVLIGDKTYLLDLTSKEICELDGPNTSRLYAGVVKYQSNVYAFGGGDEASRSGESLDVEQRVWSAVADMQYPRRTFTPCLHEQTIYLPDTSQTHRVLEAYSLEKGTFAVLAVELPSTLQGESVSFMSGNELVVLTSAGQVGRWEGQDWNEAEAEGGWSCAAPIRVEAEVCWVSAEGALFRLTLVGL